MMSLNKYAFASMMAATACVYHAFNTREQFYPAMLYLSTSKLSIAILGNLIFAVTLLVGKLMKRIFLGTLRESEVERLQERAREAIMETCLAMTIFREEFNVHFVVLFVALLFVKMGHWLAQDRVEFVETTPAVSRLAHVRLVTFLGLLLLIDQLFIQHAVNTTMTKGPSVLLYFGFEYVILASTTASTIVKYAMFAADMAVDGRWESKGLYVFYLELVTDLLHIFVYLFFFLIIMKYYGFPLHLMRDLWSTINNFHTRVADFIRYRRITTNMNERFPDVTAEELEQSDAVCIICREEMTSAKKLPCGHLFHTGCLRSWLERQQTCPTCRAPLLAAADAATPAPAAAAANAAAAGADGVAANAEQQAQDPPATPQEAAAQAQAQAAQAAWYAAHLGHAHAHWYPPAAAAQQQQRRPTTTTATTATAGSVGSTSSTGAAATAPTTPPPPPPQGWAPYGPMHAYPYMQHPMAASPGMYMGLMSPGMMSPGMAGSGATSAGGASDAVTGLTPEQHHAAAAAAAAAATATLTSMFPMAPFLYFRPPWQQPTPPPPAATTPGSPAFATGAGQVDIAQVLNAAKVLQDAIPALVAHEAAAAAAAAANATAAAAASPSDRPQASGGLSSAVAAAAAAGAEGSQSSAAAAGVPLATHALAEEEASSAALHLPTRDSVPDSVTSELRRRRLERFESGSDQS